MNFHLASGNNPNPRKALQIKDFSKYALSIDAALTQFLENGCSQTDMKRAVRVWKRTRTAFALLRFNLMSDWLGGAYVIFECIIFLPYAPNE